MHFCGSHRYGATILNIIGNDIVQRKCFCKRETASRLYEFCRQIRYRLNFRCHKICLDKVPDFMLPRVKALSKYLREKHTAVTTDSLKNLVDNIIVKINSSRDDINSLNDIVIKRLQEDSIWLRVNCECLEKSVDLLQSQIDNLRQYHRRNNLILSGIPDSVSDNHLEKVLTTILSDIGPCDNKLC